jgi:hypothetical protein
MSLKKALDIIPAFQISLSVAEVTSFWFLAKLNPQLPFLG